VFLPVLEDDLKKEKDQTETQGLGAMLLASAEVSEL
jgi:hypothetical protein